MALVPDDVEFTDDEEDWGPGPDEQSGAVGIVIQSSTADPYLLRAFARFMVGGAAEGSELFFDRLKAWNTNTQRLGSQIYHEAPDESRSERLRFAILGLAARGADVAQSTLLGTVAITESAYRHLFGPADPSYGEPAGAPSRPSLRWPGRARRGRARTVDRRGQSRRAAQPGAGAPGVR